MRPGGGHAGDRTKEGFMSGECRISEERPGEYALLVAGSPECVEPEKLARLASEATIVVAADAGADHLGRIGVLPDILVGDMDSIEPGTLAACRDARTRIVEVPRVKDESDLGLALGAIEQEGFSRVVAAAVLGGRIDHTLAAIGVLSRASLDRVEVRGAHERMRFIGRTAERSLLLSDIGLFPQETFSVFGCSPDAVMSASGTAYEVRGLALAPFSDRGLSNVACRSDARVTADAGRILVIAPDRSYAS